jgi:hypothetical protein
MDDNYYPIEIKIASKNGWQTPQEAAAYYGNYSRDGIAIHWWGNGWGADRHDDLVNYELGQAALGNKSVNYVVSDNKITLVVSPDNVAWCTFAWNAKTISIEIQPTLGAEGYKKLGWLIAELRGRYNKQLWIKGHNTLLPGSTECPGTLDLGRMEAEAQKWASGGYNPAPIPTPTPTPPPTPTVQISYSKLPAPVKYLFNKDTQLWNFNAAKWGSVSPAVPAKSFKKGDEFVVDTIADNHNLNAHYGMTAYSVSKGVTSGVNMVDLDLAPQPTPTPVPIPSPSPAPPPPTLEQRVSALEAFVNSLIEALLKIGIDLSKYKK